LQKKELREFRRTMRRFERLMIEARDCGCSTSGTTVAQCHLLLGIEETQPTTITDLADELELDRSTISRTVEGVVDMGLVTREADSSDRRCFNLILTPEGKQTVAEIHRENDRYFSRLLASVPKSRRKQIVDGLELLVEVSHRS
jgi:DNA-binding MarR family transcriptional regulator